MNNDIYIKSFSENNISSELLDIGFDSSYINEAKDKYQCLYIKIYNLKSPEANILKQLCLSLGFDSAVSHGAVNCSVQYTSCIMTPSKSQLYNLIQKLRRQPYRLNFLASKLACLLTDNKKSLIINNTIFDFRTPYLVGILNLTPDSFSDGNEFNTLEKAVNRVKELIIDGADIIDIGAESTKPGSTGIDSDTELNRLVPVIRAIRSINRDVVLSVDTRKSKVAKEAVLSGANIINDVSGLTFDPEMKNFLKNEEIPFVFVCEKKFESGDIVDNVYRYFNDSLCSLLNSGFKRENIIFDVGIGFNKSTEENFELIKRSSEFSFLNIPMFWGISRKSFIQNTFSLSPKECDDCTGIYNLILAKNGANFLRVHNVKKQRELLTYQNLLLKND